MPICVNRENEINDVREIPTEDIIIVAYKTPKGIVTLEMTKDGGLVWMLYDKKDHMLKCRPSIDCDFECEVEK